MNKRKRNRKTCFERAGEGGEGGVLAETVVLEEVAAETVRLWAVKVWGVKKEGSLRENRGLGWREGNLRVWIGVRVAAITTRQTKWEQRWWWRQQQRMCVSERNLCASSTTSTALWTRFLLRFFINIIITNIKILFIFNYQFIIHYKLNGILILKM